MRKGRKPRREEVAPEPRRDWIADRRERFEVAYRRPLPWYSLVSDDEFAEVVSAFAHRALHTRDEIFADVLTRGKPIDFGWTGLSLQGMGLRANDELVL